MDKKPRMKRALLGLAIGDAFGQGYEFNNKEVNWNEYVVNDSEDTHPPARYYTDDTQMSLAVAELLIANESITKENFAKYFVAAFKRDPINGYARRFQALLEEIKDGDELLERIKPHSIRNGAAMRSIPVGVLKTPELVVKAAYENASVTHDTIEGKISSALIALAAHQQIYHPHKDMESYAYETLKKYEPRTEEVFNEEIRSRFLEQEKGILGVPCDGLKTVAAVFYVIDCNKNAKGILEKSIDLRGDTDSVAGLALGLYAINNDIDLPEWMFTNVTHHKYGKDYIEKIGEELDEKVNL